MTQRRRPQDGGRDSTDSGEAGESPAKVVPIRPDAQPPAQKRGKRRTLLHGAWRGSVMLVAVAVAICVSVAVLLSAIVIRQERLVAPDWLRAAIETRLETQFPGLRVDFDALSLVFEEGNRMRIRLDNVKLAMTDGRTYLTVAAMSGDLAALPLLEGRIEPEALSMSGLQLLLRRSADGSIDLFSAGAPGFADASEAGRDLTTAVKEVKSLLASPNLDRLERIEATGITIAYEDERAGRSWSVDGGRMELDKDGPQIAMSGDFALLGGHSYATVIRTSYETQLDQEMGDFSISVSDVPAGDLASQSPALAWLGVLDAPISGALRMPLENGVPAGPINATLRIGAGVLQPTPDVRPIPFTSARSYFSFDPAARMLRFTELSVDSAWIHAVSEGALRLDLPPGGPVEMVGQLNLSSLTADLGAAQAEALALEGALSAPAGEEAAQEADPDDATAAVPEAETGDPAERLNLDSGQIDMRLRLDPFRLELGAVTLRDGDVTLGLRGALETKAGNWDLSLDGKVAEISSADLMARWPAALAPKPRKWVRENIRAGQLENVQLGLLASNGAAPDLYLGFEFRDAAMRVVKGLPLMTGARGQASLLRNRFAVQAEAGQIAAPGRGALDVAGTAFIVEDTRQKPSPGEVRLHLRGAIPDALALLDQKPFQFLTKAGQSVDMAQGQADLQAVVNLPLRKAPIPPEEIDLSLKGTLSNVTSDVLVPGRTLTAQRLTVEGTMEQLTVAGKAAVDGAALEGQWQGGLGKAAAGGSQVTARVTLDETFAEVFKIGLPKGAITGRGQGDLVVKLDKEVPPRMRLTSDLAGLGLRIDALGWRLSEGAKGDLEITGTLDQPPSFDLLKLEAPGLSAKGSVALNADGSMQALSFDRVQAGSWLDAPVVLRGRGAGVPPAVEITGGRVDIRGLPAPSGKASGPINLALDRLVISDGMWLGGMRANFPPGRGISGGFTGRLNGGAAIAGQVTPTDRGNAIRLTSSDAGAVLTSARLLKSASDGHLVVDLVPLGPKGSYDGTALIKDISVYEAPVIAEIMSGLSIVGLIEQMAGEGLKFTEVDAAFRITPDRVTIKSASAVGASTGISVDGYYYPQAKQLDLQGVFSPFYLLNAVGSLLTRKGEGLIGMNFTLQGPVAAPRVQVNPLSLLTPGAFREIFRRAPPKPE